MSRSRMMRIIGILGNFISSSCSKGRGKRTNNRFAPLTASHTLMWMRMAMKEKWTPTPTARLDKRLSDSLRFARWDHTFWRVNGALCIYPWGVIHREHRKFLLLAAGFTINGYSEPCWLCGGRNDSREHSWYTFASIRRQSVNKEWMNSLK